MKKMSLALCLSVLLLTGCQLQVVIEESVEESCQTTSLSQDEPAPVEGIEHQEPQERLDPRYLKIATLDDGVHFTVHRGDGYFVVKASRVLVRCAFGGPDDFRRCDPHEVRFEIRPEHEFYEILKQAFHPRDFELRSPASLYWAHHHWLIDQGWPTMNIQMPSPDYSVTFKGVLPDPVPDAFVCKVGRKDDTVTGECQSLLSLVNQVRMTLQGGV
ncbi:MAG: hypothetical protein KGQ59_00160 [Bdellovibrionales bacterium]|nr:hypothetical protein [Bdellovibrionales bacterium]